MSTPSSETKNLIGRILMEQAKRQEEADREAKRNSYILDFPPKITSGVPDEYSNQVRIR